MVGKVQWFDIAAYGPAQTINFPSWNVAHSNGIEIHCKAYRILLKSRLHEHQVQNPDSNLDHNPHGRGGLSLDLNPVCLRENDLDQDLDQNYSDF